jgi:hypothetical protein
MSARPALWFSLLLILSTAGCSRPFVLLPGGALEGTPAAVPESWSFTDAVETVQLETRPADPYSVNVACAIVGDRLYVSGGDTKTRWVGNIEADPLVRARIDGDVYELRARRVVDDAELRAFAVAWMNLGSWARDPTKLGEVWVYQLGPR